MPRSTSVDVASSRGSQQRLGGVEAGAGALQERASEGDPLGRDGGGSGDSSTSRRGQGSGGEEVTEEARDHGNVAGADVLAERQKAKATARRAAVQEGARDVLGDRGSHARCKGLQHRLGRQACELGVIEKGGEGVAAL